MSQDNISATYLLECFKSRVAWPTMQKILNNHGLSAGQGWTKTIQKLSSFSELGQEQANKVNSLEDAYFEHLLVGEKAVRFFSLDADSISKIAKYFESVQLDECFYTNSFPYPIDDEKLAKADNLPHLVKIETVNNGLAVIFCTKRIITERKELDLEELSEVTLYELKEYDEIIAVKRHMRQFFDVVKINSETNTIKVLIDNSGGISSDDQTNAFKQITSFFNRIVVDSGVSGLPLGEPVNLYPLLGKLYNDGNEGQVCEIAFITDEHSIKQERMRRKNSDLRTETYHSAGRNAVPQIVPYRLGVCWDFNISVEVKSKPELMLAGKLATLSETSPQLSRAIICNCVGLDDYSFVIQKINGHLNEFAKQNRDSQENP